MPRRFTGASRSAKPLSLVQGVSGVREEWHYNSTYRCIGAAAMTEIEYVFAANGRIYDFDYTYRQGDAGNLSTEFDQLVMSTVTFSAA